LANIERGAFPGRRGTRQKIAAALGVKPEVLFDD
jgi:hypothetical protein